MNRIGTFINVYRDYGDRNLLNFILNQPNEIIKSENNFCQEIQKHKEFCSMAFIPYRLVIMIC